MNNYIRRMRTLENHNGFGEKGKPFAVFFKDEAGTLRDRENRVITNRGGMYWDADGNVIEIPHRYAVIVRDDVRP